MQLALDLTKTHITLKKKNKENNHKKLALSAISSMPFVVRMTFAPAFKSFSMRSFVMSASLQWK